MLLALRPVRATASALLAVPLLVMPLPRPAADQAVSRAPLAGRVVVLDPGHNLGNFSHRRQINRLVDAGGFRKPCNTTGTATTSGYRESTFTMAVARDLRARLEREGASVYLTRYHETRRGWGPCVDVRGELGNRVHADAVISIHADGTASRLHGFFVIRPARKRGWTDDIDASSRTLSASVRAGLRSTGLPYANYYGSDGFDTRGDLGTLNHSDVPIVMVELGNMKNPTDARHMRSAGWRDRVYAAGLARGVTRYLLRPSR